MRFTSYQKRIITMIFIVLLAFFLRTIGLNWDQNQHLHPDERFLTMTTEKLEIPLSFREYLDPVASPMNPYNKETPFFVYGVLPLTIIKLLAIRFSMNTYDGIAIIGRLVSAIFDVGVLIFIYRIMLLLKNRLKIEDTVVLLAPALYALLVLPIQLSHFYTVDNFLNFFSIGGLYFALKYFIDRKMRNVVLVALFFGLALSSKISTVYMLPLLLILLVVPQKADKLFSKNYIISKVGLLFIVGLVGYGVLRVADPHLFASASLFNPAVSSQFLTNIKELSHFASSSAGYFPPAIQWYGRTPLLFAFTNMAIFGVGIPLTIFAILGMALFLEKGTLEVRVIILWSLLFFLFQSTRFAPSMRYFIILYPLFAIFAAYGFYVFLQRFKTRKVKMTIALVVMFLFLIWPMGFVSIYKKSHSRVQASYWINKNIPSGSTIATEHWDDGLPLRLPDIENNPYNLVSLPVFGEDTEQKWQEINTALEKSDYIIFSSNRGYGSIERVPKMYPRMAKWYRDLFDGKLPFKNIADIGSYPSWCIPLTTTCWSFSDQWSEEAFTVYDHPRVLIFKKTY